MKKAIKLIRFKDNLEVDEQKREEHFGILFENNWVLCFCCGGWFEPENYEITEQYHGFEYLNERGNIMRDPKRIREFCNDLATIWENVPDWRFGQLISNVFGEYVSETKRDIFFPEDDEIMDFMKNYFNHENASPWRKDENE